MNMKATKISQQERVQDKMASQLFALITSCIRDNQNTARDMVELGLVTCLVRVLSHVWKREVFEPICLAVEQLLSRASR